MIFGMIDLRAIQQEHREWADRNFPNENLEQATLGAAEEIGELCHAVLKRVQGIRGYDDDEKFQLEAGDAIGDCIIFLLSVCDHSKLDLAEVIKATWGRVRMRDWNADKLAGGEELDSELGNPH